MYITHMSALMSIKKSNLTTLPEAPGFTRTRERDVTLLHTHFKGLSFVTCFRGLEGVRGPLRLICQAHTALHDCRERSLSGRLHDSKAPRSSHSRQLLRANTVRAPSCPGRGGKGLWRPALFVLQV